MGPLAAVTTAARGSPLRKSMCWPYLCENSRGGSARRQRPRSLSAAWAGWEPYLCENSRREFSPVKLERDEWAVAGGGGHVLDRRVEVLAEEERHTKVEAVRQRVGAAEIVEGVEGRVAIEQRVRVGNAERDVAHRNAGGAGDAGGERLRARGAIEALLVWVRALRQRAVGEEIAVRARVDEALVERLALENHREVARSGI